MSVVCQYPNCVSGEFGTHCRRECVQTIKPQVKDTANVSDADAFRLMADRRLRVMFSKNWVQADSRTGAWREPIEGDLYAAVRRSIVKAAAGERGGIE